MSTAIPTITEKCKGAMLATAIGDALGWPSEQRSKNTANTQKINDHFVEWTRCCTKPYWHNEKILPGEYSDDTQMTLSVARSIIAGNWEKALINELQFWLKYERGGGKALLKAAESCKKGLFLWQSSYTRDYFNAGGNGATMRILPHVIAVANTPEHGIAALITDVIKNSIITHGHPRAILGATCYAYALNYLLQKNSVLEYGELVNAVLDAQGVWGAFPDSDKFTDWIEAANRHSDYTHNWKTCLANMVKQLEFIKASLKKGLMLEDNSILTQLECFAKVNGAGDVAILAAIYLVSKYANNPSLGIKVPAFAFGADTDTIASITGGLLGMLSGTDWIPIEWKIVQDNEYIIKITELLLSNNSKEASKTIDPKIKEQANGWKSSPIGLLHQVNAETIQCGKNDAVIITKWKSVWGQTMYIKEHKQNDQKFNLTGSQMQLPLQLFTDGVKLETVVEKIVTEQKHSKQFILKIDDVATLLDKLPQRITFKKVFKIIAALLGDNKTSAAIAKQQKIDQATVDLIKTCVKEF